MTNQSRRRFLQKAIVSSISLKTLTPIPYAKPASNLTDISIENISFTYEEHRYRAPYKFGGVPVDRATILNVNATVRTRGGKQVKGFGSMPLGNVWSFPSREMLYNTTLGAMKTLA